MKDAEFNFAGRKWDAYRAFYNNYGPLTHFETGEVMVRSHLNPCDRRWYDKFGIKIVSTADDSCPTLYLDEARKNPVKKAWVTENGMQVLVVDHQQKVAVAPGQSGSYRAGEEKLRPTHLSNAIVWWTGPNRMPITEGEIRISEPDREAAKLLRPKLAEVRAAATAAYRMSEKRYWSSEKLEVGADWALHTVEEMCQFILSDAHKTACVAKSGFKTPRKIYRVSKLYV